MDEKKPGGLQNNWSSIALIAAVAANLLWLQGPLKSSRPPQKAAFEGTALGDQNAEARLWQDPFEAITLDQQRKSEIKGRASRLKRDHYTIDEIRQQIDYRAKRGGELIIMPVMVTGSPYNEGAEWRIRSRFAVLAGLSRSGYVPSDAEHVGYFEMGWPRSETLNQSEKVAQQCLSETAGGNCLGLTVPFEWFQVKERIDKYRADAVLLLWVKDDMFEHSPLKRLALFTRALTVSTGAEKERPKNIKIKIIGPWSSTTLEAMLGDSTELKDVEIYSPSATAPDRLLLTNISTPPCTETQDPRKDVREILEKKIKFHNVTLTDDQLVCALIDELRRRGVDPNKDAIALVSEWDTFYGRALPETFSQLIQKKESIRLGSYLRGLDGKLAGRESSSPKTIGDSSNEKEEGVIKRREIAPLERPEGNSQLDYIPRLAAQLKDGDLKLNADRKIKAIGVLGSDVYDKLLLLQSLRMHFPNVIFFTTDLDARLFHFSELNWSRNLIVASSFGLALKDELQREIPPFRDSYQTATFLASQLALPNKTKVEVSDKLNNSITPLLPVQLFEIGRGGAYPLSAGQTMESVHPPNPHSLKDLVSPSFLGLALRLLLFISLVLLLIGYFSPTAREFGKIVRKTFRLDTEQPPAPFQHFKVGSFRALVWSLILLPVVFAIAICVAHFSGQDEPFSLIDGISIWPAEVIRLAAAYLSLYFLFLTRSELATNKDALSKDFCLPDRIQSTKEIEELCQRRRENEIMQQDGAWRKLKIKWNGWGAFVRSISINSWDPGKNILADDGEEKVAALRLWKDYNWLGSFRHRVFRFVPILLIYMFSATMLAGLLGSSDPFAPYRGQISYWTNMFVLYFTVITLIFLIFFVVDAAQLSRKFIDNLGQRTTKWPDATYQKFERDYRIHRDYLDEWIDIHLIGERTKVVGKLIFYPFIVLFLTIISRYEFFDRWDWPILLILVFGLNSAYAIYAVLVIRRSAERARQEAIVKLKQKLLKVLGGETKFPEVEDIKEKVKANEPDSDHTNSNLPEQIRLLIQGVESYEEGAFVPLSKHPVIGALAIPFGGAGILAVVDYLTSM